jgi:hypothetical protein
MSQTTIETPRRAAVELERFEFSFFVNDNIICQRYFKIRDFDEKFAPLNEESARHYKSNTAKELEKINVLKELGDSVAGVQHGIIPNFLKLKSMDYLWENYKPYYAQNIDSYKTTPKKGDMFQFEVKVDSTSILKVEFPNEYFTLNPKINVDIREVIQEIITEVRDFLSVKNNIKVSN